ncbi:interleukin-10 receptor subunit alpha [Pseudonaja textilis]|uniref:interleukin-10 receptor subunit alpha n=1 Tax=Pseudonaja textilis TaxID=8673 RepID=UPI000EA89E57|nr:interleukin-10 receptor subunit alpha [Pseudonaja textilis]
MAERWVSALLLLLFLAFSCLSGHGEGRANRGDCQAADPQEASGRGGCRTQDARPLPVSSGGERVLAAPTDVRFQARVFHHLLRWKPGPKPAGGVLYEVQYRRVGKDSWRAAANCTRIALDSCDLTCETQQPAFHYLARVRAIAGNRSSAWTWTRRFTPSEATLWLSKVTLSRSGNQLRVSLQRPTSCWANLTYEGSYEAWGEYLARVRRVSNNQELVHVHSSLEFDLPPLLGGEQYCISVKPRVASLPNAADWTEEQCVSIPPLEEYAVLTPSLAFLTLLSLGILGAALGLASVYTKKTTRMPSVLKSPLGHNFCWGLREESKSHILHMETESIQQLFFLGPQDQAHLAKRGSLCIGAVLPEKNCQQEEGRGLEEGSGCSADSGICLQETFGSLDNLHFTLDLGQKTGTQKEAGSVGIIEQLPLGEEGSPSKDLARAHSSGYKQQSGAPLDPEDCPRPPSSVDGEALSHPSQATGYLKQTFLEAPPGLQGIALPKDFLHRVDRFPSSTASDVLGP